ncbi:YDG/SRA domain-containing protein [Amycolatopsis jejuensis]|uniref:YDG/SRA domain-containing protein n=1 Tax=Amycolatopsis jejuensis TaxID=330084 RepID=UPI00138E44E2|nr:YDG/SRA domain-containing protein [Amycolatopsis jejuensis]
MAFADIRADHVRAAVVEFERLQQGEFLARYGLPSDKRYDLLVEPYAYPARAIVCRAYHLATGGKLPTSQANGAIALFLTCLTDLGFEVIDRETAPRFGEIPGVPEGTTFVDRRAAQARGTHRAGQAGIVGTGQTGAESIVVSGGYGDQDYGSVILYVGHGGRAKNSKKQIADQSFAAPGNAALLNSCTTGASVRVVRGAHPGSDYAPKSGYRYDGLFRVDHAEQVRLDDGFVRCLFWMSTLTVDVLSGPLVPVEISATDEEVSLPPGKSQPGRRTVVAERVIRVTRVARGIKLMYRDTCQMCRVQLAVGDRTYSEGAHIKALGSPHNGDDEPRNMLCLCPNCHALFDLGGIIIRDDLSLIRNGSPAGSLHVLPGHEIDMKSVAYHRAAARRTALKT